MILLEFERMKTCLLNLKPVKHPKVSHFGRVQMRPVILRVNALRRVTNLKVVIEWEEERNLKIEKA